MRRYTITMKPCGSGERIIEMGGYEAGLARVKDPHRITWGMKDFPIYCVHCPVMEMLTFENTGHLDTVRLVSEPMRHGFCHFAFYKDPADIPRSSTADMKRGAGDRAVATVQGADCVGCNRFVRPGRKVRNL